MSKIKLMLVAGGLLASIAFAFGQKPATGTEVVLRFDDPVSSKTAKIGDHVHLHVAKDIVDNGHTLIKSGTPVTAVISNVDKRGRYGKNATMRIALDPIKASNGEWVTLEPRDKGKAFQGSNTDKAALATGGAALVFGPIGLVSGYFIPGKQVDVKAGDSLRTVVSRVGTTRS